jgi:hypothetical protein
MMAWRAATELHRARIGGFGRGRLHIVVNGSHPRFLSEPAPPHTFRIDRAIELVPPSLKRKSRSGSGGLLQGDGVAEAFELGDEALGGALGVAALEVGAAGVAIGLAGLQHVPDGDEQRVSDRE